MNKVTLTLIVILTLAITTAHTSEHEIDRIKPVNTFESLQNNQYAIDLHIDDNLCAIGKIMITDKHVNVELYTALNAIVFTEFTFTINKSKRIADTMICYGTDQYDQSATIKFILDSNNDIKDFIIVIGFRYNFDVINGFVEPMCVAGRSYYAQFLNLLDLAKKLK